MKNLIEHPELNNLMRPPRVGEILEATVVGGGRSALYLDLEARGAGVVFGKEFHEAKEAIKNLKEGDKIFVKVVDPKNEEGYTEVSLSAAGKEIAWERLKRLKDEREAISVKIIGANKGGLLAEVERIQAFLPASQLNSEHYPRVDNADQSQILHELQKLIGQELQVHVLDLDPKEEKLILSEKIKESERIKDLLSAYKIGDVVEGEITGVVDFGAFIKFPALPAHPAGGPALTADKKGKSVSPSGPEVKKGDKSDAQESDATMATDKTEELEGLIHISELDWQIIDNPEDILKMGQKTKAKIIKIEGDRVFLSLKAMKPDPWEGIEKKHKKGDPIKGKVIKLAPFGALVEIPENLYGLCHISEFGTKSKMEEQLEIGRKYEFIIDHIDQKEHKMSLKVSIKEPPLSLQSDKENV